MSRHNLESLLSFLSQLAMNNNRPWFEQHKSLYDEARSSFEGLVAELIDRMSAYDDLSDVSAKNSIMRIYRDVRFSKDKTPYNAWMAAHIAPGGKKSGHLGFGIRLAPGDSGAAGGLWDPAPEQLAAFRRAVDADKKGLLALVKNHDFSRLFGGLQGESLKSVPRGYEKDHPAAEFLKLKQIYVSRPFQDEAVCADDFVDQLVKTFVTMKPFLDYLNGVIS
jgi:uncharacterized protein (TIGR02453 family)